MLRRVCQLLADTLLLALFLFVFAWAISRNEARAASTLLENSSYPASMDECEKATGKRPDWTVSFQNATGHWHHRTCGYRS